MWKPWKKPNYTIPKKPKGVNRQLSMLWDSCYNHIPSRLDKVDWRLHWQDIKLNFILALIALILAFIGVRIFL